MDVGVKHFSPLPSTGYGFLLADRVFGRTEEILKKKAIITKFGKYNEIYSMVGPLK